MSHDEDHYYRVGDLIDDLLALTTGRDQMVFIKGVGLDFHTVVNAHVDTSGDLILQMSE